MEKQQGFLSRGGRYPDLMFTVITVLQIWNGREKGNAKGNPPVRRKLAYVLEKPEPSYWWWRRRKGNII